MSASQSCKEVADAIVSIMKHAYSALTLALSEMKRKKKFLEKDNFVKTVRSAAPEYTH